jgi:hypothetical protein
MQQQRAVHPRPAIHVVMGPNRLLHVGPGGHIRVATKPLDYAFSVVDDLGNVVDLPDGEAVLAECDALGRSICIVKPDPPTDPPNGYVEPDDRRAATMRGIETGLATADGEPILGTGTGSGSRISYDPADWPRPGDPASPGRAQVLLALLRQAAIYAKGADNPTDGRTLLESGR